MVSPIISTSVYTSLILAFNHMLDYHQYEMLIAVETSSDVMIWNEVWSTNVTAYIDAESLLVDIENADLGSDNFQIEFTFDGPSNKLTNDLTCI